MSKIKVLIESLREKNHNTLKESGSGDFKNGKELVKFLLTKDIQGNSFGADRPGESEYWGKGFKNYKKDMVDAFSASYEDDDNYIFISDIPDDKLDEIKVEKDGRGWVHYYFDGKEVDPSDFLDKYKEMLHNPNSYYHIVYNWNDLGEFSECDSVKSIDELVDRLHIDDTIQIYDNLAESGITKSEAEKYLKVYTDNAEFPFEYVVDMKGDPVAEKLAKIITDSYSNRSNYDDDDYYDDEDYDDEY